MVDTFQIAIVHLHDDYGRKLGGGFKCFFLFHPYLGKWSNLTNIFQMGWNHQLVIMGEKSIEILVCGFHAETP